MIFPFSIDFSLALPLWPIGCAASLRNVETTCTKTDEFDDIRMMEFLDQEGGVAEIYCQPMTGYAAGMHELENYNRTDAPK